MKKLSNLLFIFVGLLLISGCTRTPSCSDEKTVNLVKTIFANSIQDSVKRDKENASKNIRQITQSSDTNKVSALFDGLAEKISSSAQITINTIRIASHDDKIDKYTCDAELSVALPANFKKTVEGLKAGSPNVLKMLVAGELLGFQWTEKLDGIADLNPDAVKQDIHYTSQLTEEKGEHLVELRGHMPLVEMLVAIGTISHMGEMNAPVKADSKNSQPQSEAAIPSDQAGSLVGKQPSEIAGIEPYRSKLKTLLGATFETFENNLSVGDEIRHVDGYYFGSGCLPHSCNVSEAAFAISKQDQSIYVVIMDNGEFQMMGADAQTLPVPLKEWVKERGGKL